MPRGDRDILLPPSTQLLVYLEHVTVALFVVCFTLFTEGF